MVTVYYNKKLQIKISKAKRHIRQSPEETTRFKSSSRSGVIWTALVLPATMWDSTNGVLPAREARSGHHVHGLYWGSVKKA